MLYICPMNKQGHNIRIIHETMGELLNETFVDQIQFKLFLKMVHASLELDQNLSFFNGETFLINIPFKILRDSVVVTSSIEFTMVDQVRSKIEALVTK